MRTIFILCLLLAAPATAGVGADSLLCVGLRGLGLEAGEIDLHPESSRPDSRRLPLVSDLLSAPAFYRARIDSLLISEGSRRPLLMPDSALPAAQSPLLFWPALDPLPATLALLERLGDGERAWLLSEGLHLLDELDPADQIRDLFELRRQEEELALRADSLLALFDRVFLDSAATTYLQWSEATLLQAIAFARSVDDGRPPLDGHRFPDGSRAEGPLLWAGASESGNFVIGGDSGNRYEGSFALIVDSGGADDYSLDAVRRGAEGGLRFILDTGGNDIYEAREDAALAGGYLGAAVLIDTSGDDIYRARSFDLGCGWLGFGLLVDHAGDDTYLGDRMVMAAAGFGEGRLLDRRGDDIYRAHLYAQGFGFTGGTATLHDLAGHDLYAATPLYTDLLRYEDHALSLSQGFGYGHRPDWSGGIGLLLDDGGNDSYLSDIYGQGCAYWYGLGVLRDRSGNDSYTCYQYGQGAGIHLAVGLLRDESGNDSYSIHGVGQGCGHDLALGVLEDLGGNDRYACDDLSQGAGNANGMGVLLDLRGLDGYLGKNSNARAWGNRRRHFGSIGLCVDGAGDDWISIPTPPEEERRSFRGLWLDLHQPQTGPVWDPGPAIAYRDSPRSHDDYFLMAAAGEPRFRLWQQAGRDSLLAHAEEALPALIAHFDTKSARERHTLKNLTRDMGAVAVDPLREILREGKPEYHRQAAWCLEHLGDRRALPELLSMLASPRDWKDEVAALSALSRLEDLAPDEINQLVLACRSLAGDMDTPELVLKEAVAVLDRQNAGSADLLLDLAMRGPYAVRWTATEALGRRSGWHAAFIARWRQASSCEDLLHLSELLPRLKARELSHCLRSALRTPAGRDPQLREALGRAVDLHPDAQGPVLRGLRERLTVNPDKERR